MRVTTICNQKGGVAKTTTTWTMAAGIHKRGMRVLLIDVDPQTNLSYTAGADLLSDKPNLYNVFKGTPAREAIQTIRDGLDIIPGSILLAKADKEFTGITNYHVIKNIIKAVGGDYDHIIIDTPPTIGILTENALLASQSIIIPMKPNVYALQGMSQLHEFITELQQENKELSINGLLITLGDERTNVYKTIVPLIESTAESMGTKVFKSRIRKTTAIEEAAINQTDVLTDAPTATASMDYENFINEFLEG